MAYPFLDVETLRGLVLSSTEPQPLERLSRAVQLALELELSGDRLVDGFVSEARDAGCSWAQIGVTLGVTKQAAQQRFVSRIEPAAGGDPLFIGPKNLGVIVSGLLQAASEEARQLGHNYIGTEHMLLALLEARGEIASHALMAVGITADAVRIKIKDAVDVRQPRQWKSLGIRPNLKQALELSRGEARRFGHSNVCSQHLLLGLVRVEDSLAARILSDLGANPERVRAQLAEMLGVTARELATKPGRRSARLTPR